MRAPRRWAACANLQQGLLAGALCSAAAPGASQRSHHHTGAIVPTRCARVAQHTFSKASGRKSALESPLRFDPSLQSRTLAEPSPSVLQEKQRATDEASSGAAAPGGGTDGRSAGNSVAGRRFSSQGRQGSAPRSATWEATPLPATDPRRRHHSPSTSPLVLPYSELAYRSRLQHARLATLLELADAPYAPSPLQILLDVLGEASRLQALVGDTAVDAAVAAVSPTVDGGTDHTPTQRAEAQAALARLSAALARAQDVRCVLQRAVGTTQEVVRAVEVIGDRDSMAALQATQAAVEHFATTLIPSPEGSTAPVVDLAEASEGTRDVELHEGATAMSCQLSSPAYAEVLHTILELSRPLGLRLTAVNALAELIALSEQVAAAQSSSHRAQGSEEAHDDDDDDDDGDRDAYEEVEFSLDDVVTLVDTEVQGEFRPVGASDHLHAIESCGKAGDFDLAISLYRRFLSHAQAGAFPVSVGDLSDALTALAHSSHTAVHFAKLQQLIIRSEVAGTVPVSVPLYTALIDAVSRATDHPQRMSIALALYRRLRDGQLTPTADTYAALIACCASTREPTHAFAFYQEARLVCGVASFTPQVYANLLLSYATAGYGADARRTLDVLVEAGAPLTRGAFHAVLSGAVTLREAREVLEMMTQQYAIQPTPHTFAFLVHAAAKEPTGASTALQLFDLHEEALTALLDMDSSTATAKEEGAHMANSSSQQAGALEATLHERFPLYVRAVEHALMRLRVDPSMDPRLGKYLKPLLRVAQHRMNAFTGGMAPQTPTRIPDGAEACVAVLAPDVLANLDEWVEPFVHCYSAIVIPYSALLALRKGGGTRVEGLTVKGAQAGLHDAVWADAGDEQSAVVEHRRRRLVKFLQDYKDVIHLVSLEEELGWSREVRRYHISTTNWFARCAAFAMNLARRDLPTGTKLYAEHPEAVVVLVSANHHSCGKFVVDLKRAYLQDSRRERERHAGLREGLEKVFYHNPVARPAWSPPKLSIRNKRRQRENQHEDEAAAAAAARHRESTRTAAPHVASDVLKTSGVAVDAQEAEQLYRRHLVRLGGHEKSLSSGGASGNGTDKEEEQRQPPPPSLPWPKADDALDAELLASMLTMDE